MIVETQAGVRSKITARSFCLTVGSEIKRSIIASCVYRIFLIPLTRAPVSGSVYIAGLALGRD